MLRRSIYRILSKSRGSFGGEALEIVHGGLSIKDSSFEFASGSAKSGRSVAKADEFGRSFCGRVK